MGAGRAPHLRTGGGTGRRLPRALIATQLGLLADPPVAVAVIERSNPAAQLPDAGQAARALASVPFKVVLDLVITDTARLADVVLPCASGLEEEDFFAGYWHEYPMWSLGAVSAPAGVRSERAIWSELARRLGLGDWIDRPAAAWIRDALAPLAPHAIGEAHRGSWFRNPLAKAVPWADGVFATKDGLYHFPGEPAQGVRYGHARAAMPGGGGHVEETPEEAGGSWPLWLISPQHRLTLHSQFQHARRGAADEGRSGGGCAGSGRVPEVHVSARAAAAAGVTDGGHCRVVSRAGELPAVVRCEPDPWRDDVAMILGGGGLGGDGELPASANILTSAGLSDIGLGAVYYDCMVRIKQCSKPGSGAPDRQD